MTWARYKMRLARWAGVLGIAGGLAVGACSSEFAATVGATGSSGSAGTSSSSGSSGSPEAGTGEDAGQSDGGASAGGISSGGNGGHSGASGAGASSPCGGRCTAKRPLCNLKTSFCVECLTETDCKDASKSACDASTHMCVECTDKTTCSGRTPACDMPRSACVECTTKTDCTNSAKPLCDPTAETCVACLQQGDCTSPTASACNAGACTACAKDAECSNIAGKGVCNAGTCVQCTGTKFAACGLSMGTPLVCDSLQHTCTASKQSSAGLCQSCVSDAQCTAGKICVQEQFGSPAQSVGYFCFWKQGDVADGAPSDCPTQGRPYVKTLTNAMSIDGATSTICSLRSSTCIAKNEFSSKSCANPTLRDDLQCGFAPTEDSKCAAFGVGFRCTMTCGSDDDCPSNLTCNTGASPSVCNLQ